MRRWLSLVLVLLCTCSEDAVPSPASITDAASGADFHPDDPEASGMLLTFADEFDAHSVSADGRRYGTRWTDHLWFEKPLPPGTTGTAEGVLNLYGNDGFGIATVNAEGKGFAQRYGYFEARIKVPCGKGTWPAFWLISNDRVTRDAALPASELDIMEGQGAMPNQYIGTVHLDSARGADKVNKNSFTGDLGVGPLCRDFHRYGLLWPAEADKITWYFDGRPVIVAPKFRTTDSAPMMVILGNGYGDMIGSNAPDRLTPRPSLMQVDYVRVWQFRQQRPSACIGDCRAASPTR